MIKRHFVSAAPAPPVGVKYHHATEADGWLYVTGQLPADPHASSAPFPEGIAAQAEQTFENLAIIVQAARYALADTVFVRIYLTHFDRDFDGFNQSIIATSPTTNMSLADHRRRRQAWPGCAR